MIEEQYVSFETAKLLKEKGFDTITPTKYAVGKIVESWYDDYRERVVRFDWDEGYFVSIEDSKHDISGDTISAPTQQMAMRWLREVHMIGIFPSTYTKIIGNTTTHSYGTAIINLTTHELMTEDYLAKDTYEKACEAAIQYCLEHLIK